MPVFIDKPEGLITDTRHIRLQGMAQGIARLTACLTKPDNSFWYSNALFKVDKTGTVDLSVQSPLSGDWAMADSMAPVWSMKQIRAASIPEKTQDVDPLHINFYVRDAAAHTHHAQMTQTFLAPGVTCQAIAEPGLVGKVFYPAGDGPAPAVLLLNGSNGGMPLQRAALFAAQGYIAAALAYFGAPGLPRYFGDTNLEYFGHALQWIRNTLKPKDDFILVCGASRGGELSLLIASIYNEYIRGCVAFVPSAVVNGIQQAGEPGRSRDEPAWFLGGQPLPNLWKGNPNADPSIYTTPEIPGMPIRQSTAFHTALANDAFRERATIQVEKINGPILMISGSDDGCWPSETFSNMVAQRLHAHQHRWPVEHLTNPAAGHEIGFPYATSRGVVCLHPVSGLLMDFGGDVAINMQASVRSWARVMEFAQTCPEVYKNVD